MLIVHQADLSDSEKMLRQFDLASKYGPCTDLTRLERWERAFTLVSKPPSKKRGDGEGMGAHCLFEKQRRHVTHRACFIIVIYPYF
jgi:hypothetical protein